ncbi:TPA: hypothetical protein ACGXQL_004214 [Bacillus cereus]|uniref:hypothetical protein n=1 Tax=Bacillus TaxID=1386 RepID=UPI0001A100FF|nr:MULTISPECIES: hypothetical protein [Bacillus]EEL84416.1 hypothetical protein bcere0029_58690 [Bacillus cereus AH1272]EEL90559.1 hypothetical protein bcere0030_55170 [Bacillus cereus AH1273]MED2680664.1 hypothetical protein [Bacillus thuringiensis]EKS7862067.1 hypothetical protein [Bacillus cereus]MBL3742300.1 hypothetical protein [Bacillus cereus]
MIYCVKSCCENKNCSNGEVKHIATAINENAAWNTANHFNLFTPAQCPICGLDLLYFPDLDETFEQEANDT